MRWSAPPSRRFKIRMHSFPSPLRPSSGICFAQLILSIMPTRAPPSQASNVKGVSACWPALLHECNQTSEHCSPLDPSISENPLRRPLQSKTAHTASLRRGP